MAIDLYGCGCMWEELPNAVPGSNVKGYKKVSECAACQAQREADATAAADAKAAADAAQALADKRKQASDALADAEIAANPGSYQ